ncbi:MAG: cobalamin biosynthesis protein P47K [Planctomycetes bacterium]|nr:cobalamin biosynthesis protein P47K [Planctomycetota bacterium]
MVGGFLGAGKTTAVARLARFLTDRGRRVGLISNDQSRGLVDTALLRAKGFRVEEIAGGCFCCRFNSLLDAARKLTLESRPDVFVAEPVGSCTDLVATVSYPLRRIYGDRFDIAPLSVLVDPQRAARVLGLEQTGRAFSEKVVYVYRKQLEEADAIVVNKSDQLAAPLRDSLVSAIREHFPRAEVFVASALDGAGLEPWFSFVLESQPRRDADLELDYDQYAEGEALLGWLNATVRIESAEPFDANETLLRLARDLRDRIAARAVEIAHLKLTLDAEDAAGTLAAVSLVRSDAEPDLRESLFDRVDRGVLVLNLRAEAEPEFLSVVTEAALAELGRAARGLRVTVEHQECFRPGRPVPTHRMSGEPA